MTTKKCCRCKEEKDISFFHKDIKNIDGYKKICKTCISKLHGTM